MSFNSKYKKEKAIDLKTNLLQQVIDIKIKKSKMCDKARDCFCVYMCFQSKQPKVE